MVRSGRPVPTGRSGAWAPTSELRRRGRSAWMLAVVLLALLVQSLSGCSLREARVDYEGVAGDLPDLTDLRQRATAFRSTLIYDRYGELLNETFDPDAGRRTVVPLERISPLLQQATIATEDAHYYEHSGVDPIAVARAGWYLVREGEVVSGGSTIPQQLVKRLYLSPERSVRRKVVEAALATEMSKLYSKDEILELYLNEVFYGNHAYGAQAAARTYFGKDASELTLAEAALLAGLPQAPAYHDPYAHPDRAAERQAVVLGLMEKAGFITASEAEAAAAEPLEYQPVRFEMRSPHFTLLVREQVEQLFGREALYSRGLNVYTTLDSGLQAEAQSAVSEHVAALAGNGASDGALVAIRPGTGEVLAMVGSADFNDEVSQGQINMATVPRQPGSTMKPLVYLAAFEKARDARGRPWTPGTLLADIEADFPDGANPPYHPTNYDLKEHGMVTVREALASSYNVPAVRTLQAVGVPALLDVSRRMGITTLDGAQHGLALALGGAEVPLLEMTGAYAVLAGGGKYMPPTAIRKITDGKGTVLCEIGTDTPCLPGARSVFRRRAVDSVDAFLITDILSDHEARGSAFGDALHLTLDRPAAAKTGTTNDIRDAWTIGYTPNLVAGVWVGNADNGPMRGLSGYTAAAPLWKRFMLGAHKGTPVADFPVPGGVELVAVCADTGALPGDACPQTARHYYAKDRPPLPAQEDLWQLVSLDRLTGKLATEFTPPEYTEQRVYKVYPAEHRAWAEAHGIPQPPSESSDVFTFAPRAEIVYPYRGAQVSGIVTVTGTADVPLLDRYSLRVREARVGASYGVPFVAVYGRAVRGGLLGIWDSTEYENGAYDLRLRVHDQMGHTHDHTVRVYVLNDPPTATSTATATSTGTATPTAVATVTVAPSRPPATATSPPSPSPTVPPATTEVPPTPTALPPSPTSPPAASPPLPPTEDDAATSEPATAEPPPAP